MHMRCNRRELLRNVLVTMLHVQAEMRGGMHGGGAVDAAVLFVLCYSKHIHHHRCVVMVKHVVKVVSGQTHGCSWSNSPRAVNSFSLVHTCRNTCKRKPHTLLLSTTAHLTAPLHHRHRRHHHLHCCCRSLCLYHPQVAVQGHLPWQLPKAMVALSAQPVVRAVRVVR